MTNDKQQQNKKELKLQAYHFRAIELRYSGNTYKEVATQLETEFKKSFKDQTIRFWFSKNGQLDELYLDYARQENDRRRQHMREELKKLLPEIPKKFEALLNRPQIDTLTLRTVKELCSVLGFKLQGDDDTQDALDEFFDRVEDEIEKENPNPNAAADTNKVN